MSESPTVSMAAIVVCYHSNDVIQGCVEALDKTISAIPNATRPVVTLVLVANSAEDDITTVTSQECDVIRLHAPGNVGFSPGVNLALERVPDVDFVLLLNPDARPTSSCLGEMIRVAVGSQAALVGPVLVDPNGSPCGASERPFHSLRREAARQLLGLGRRNRPYGHRAASTGEARCLTGACLLADREFLGTVGGLDTTIRMYLEDVMLCWQAHENEKPVVLATTARCEHALGGSSDGDNFHSSIGLHLTMLAARVEFIRRRLGRGGAFAMRALIAMGAVARSLLLKGSQRKKHAMTLRWALASGAAPQWNDGPVVGKW